MKTRSISLDVLRILCMVLIVLHHLTIYSMGVSDFASGMCDTSTFWIGFNAFLVVGVNCFFLISGYFGIEFKFSKIVKLMLLIWFWGWFCQIASALLFGEFQLTIKSLINFFIPLHSYWFMEVYLVLMLLSKTLNDFFENKTKKEMVKILIFMFLIFSVYSFFLRTRVFGTGAGYDLPFAMFLYLVGRSINKFLDFHISPYRCFFLYLTFSILNALLACWLVGISEFKAAWTIFYYNNPLVFASSISLFLMFKNFNWNVFYHYKLFIEKVSSCVLSVYLIHASYGLGGLFVNWFKNYVRDYDFAEQLTLMICYMVIAFVICVILELVRRKLFGRIFDKIETFIITLAKRYN